MKDLIYDDSIHFNVCTCLSGHHTDSSEGARFNYLALMHKGCGRFIGEGYDVEFGPGDMYFVPIGYRYHSYWRGDGDIVWDSFAFRWFPTEQRYPVQKLEPDAEQLAVYRKLAELHRVDCSTVGMLYSLLASLLPGMKPCEKTERSIVADRAKEIMRCSPTLTIGEVARQLGVSESGLYAEFRRLGTTPVSERLNQMCDRAVELLVTTDLTVEEISERCGFGSATYFYRILKRLTGKTTRDIRRTHSQVL